MDVSDSGASLTCQLDDGIVDEVRRLLEEQTAWLTLRLDRLFDVQQRLSSSLQATSSLSFASFPKTYASKVAPAVGDSSDDEVLFEDQCLTDVDTMPGIGISHSRGSAELPSNLGEVNLGDGGLRWDDTTSEGSKASMVAGTASPELGPLQKTRSVAQRFANSLSAADTDSGSSGEFSRSRSVIRNIYCFDQFARRVTNTLFEAVVACMIMGNAVALTISVNLALNCQQ